MSEPTAQPKLLERVRATLRSRHYSPATEKAYVGWIRRFLVFHRFRHPEDMRAAEITVFLSYLATERQIGASTQNQALAALLFLYRAVLELEIPGLDGVVRARRPEHLPLVLTREEVDAVLADGEGVPAHGEGSSMARASGQPNAPASASRTSISPGARSSCGTARVRRTA